MLPKSLETLIEEFGKLPGVGPRTAERLAFYVLKSNQHYAEQLAAALKNLHHGISLCEKCFNLAEDKLCSICKNAKRTESIIAVVEEPLDVIAIEKTASFSGVYHVLGGVLSPIDGIGPDKLNIKSLLKRISEDTEEVILATNPSTEGEATAMYIQKQLLELPSGGTYKITRLARGLPVGSDLEYADQITLGRALEGRQSL